MATQWNYLVSETQFATEQVVAGLRSLCTVPIGGHLWPVLHSQTYPLHVGLHSYTSGLERLCKLTIACYGCVTSGTFPSVKKYNHKIGKLIDGVQGLNLEQIGGLQKRPAAHVADELDLSLTEMLERFANGAGRYEHLDSLWSDKANVGTLDTWNDMSGRVAVPKRIRDLLLLREGVIEAMRTLCTRNNFEVSGFGILNSIDLPRLAEPSIAVALRLYSSASWVGSVLDAVTYYTGRDDLPLLGEAVYEISGSAEDFFKYSVAQIQDEELTFEELDAHFEQFPEGEDD